MQDTVWGNDGETLVARIADQSYTTPSGRRATDTECEEANARLIAAAPELLEALKKCKAVVENGNLPPSARMEFVRDYAAPAIAKAEGRGE